MTPHLRTTSITMVLGIVVTSNFGFASYDVVPLKESTVLTPFIGKARIQETLSTETEPPLQLPRIERDRLFILAKLERSMSRFDELDKDLLLFRAPRLRTEELKRLYPTIDTNALQTLKKLLQYYSSDEHRSDRKNNLKANRTRLGVEN